MSDTARVGQKYAVIISTGRTTNIVNPVAGKRIKVLSYTLVTDGTPNTVQWFGGITLTGIMSLRDFGGINAHYCPLGLFKTSIGSALTLSTGVIANITGHLVYVLE